MQRRARMSEEPPELSLSFSTLKNGLGKSHSRSQLSVNLLSQNSARGLLEILWKGGPGTLSKTIGSNLDGKALVLVVQKIGGGFLPGSPLRFPDSTSGSKSDIGL